MSPEDRHGRPLRKLRISVTDRCNLRCAYCMPEEEYRWLPREQLLSFEEIVRFARVVRGLGVDELRLTGGEPLLRKHLVDLVAGLGELGFDKLAMTTNGVLLVEHAQGLRDAGLTSLTVSLDTLKRERFVELTRRDELERTILGIEAARAAGFSVPKINTVVMRGRNDDEILDMLDFAARVGAELRFIEYMDVGGATRWDAKTVVPQHELLASIAAAKGPAQPLPHRGAAPAQRFVLPNGQVFGVIASTTQPFCGTCDRARIVADGRFFTCLYAREGYDVRAWLRSGLSEDELSFRVASIWRGREDRGAERRLAMHERAPLASARELAADPHLEMHTRGG